jgi:hypothetical protein
MEAAVEFGEGDEEQVEEAIRQDVVGGELTDEVSVAGILFITVAALRDHHRCVIWPNGPPLGFRLSADRSSRLMQLCLQVMLIWLPMRRSLIRPRMSRHALSCGHILRAHTAGTYCGHILRAHTAGTRTPMHSLLTGRGGSAILERVCTQDRLERD